MILILTLFVQSAATLNSSNVCPPLPFVSLKNGSITSTSQDIFRFTCNHGYFLIGPSQVKCKRGNWIPDRNPRCLRSEGYCYPPPSIPHGDIWGDDYKFGSTVMYSCHPGYRLLGTGRRICETNRAWSGITPACQAEEEPLLNIAVRLEKEFIQHVGSYSNDSRARALDTASIRKGLELVILVDRSSSVDPVDFKMGIEFIKFLLSEFGVKNGENGVGTRAAVLTFGTEVDIVFNLDNENITDAQTANRILDNVKAEGGGTAMVPAMTAVFVDVSHLLRPEAKKALFLITDGEPNVGLDITPEDAARQLKKSDFEIYTVGVGKDINVDLLSRIASVPVENHVFILNKYSQLPDMVSIIKSLPAEVPKPGPERCGYIDESRKPTPNERWPWLAAVYVSFREPVDVPGNVPFKMSLCGGALICREWVLTAASCFNVINKRIIMMSLQEVFVVMGENDLLEVDKSQRNFYATDVHIHPDFDPFSPLENNLALVKLNEPVLLNITFRPICLPTTGDIRPLHQDLRTEAFTAGWGLPLKGGFTDGINAATTNYTLRTKSITLAEEGNCVRRLRSPSNIFCAGISPSDCLGNIGSPIIARHPDTNIQHILGVLTDKSDCNKIPQGHSYFIELREYLPWIIRLTRNCSSQHEI